LFSEIAARGEELFPSPYAYCDGISSKPAAGFGYRRQDPPKPYSYRRNPYFFPPTGLLSVRLKNVHFENILFWNSA
jgi:hypothetical protein